MGDRVLVQVVSGKEFSPVAYGHWSGSAAPEFLARLRDRMAKRPDDLAYTFARLVQEMTADDPDGSTGFGCWNAEAVLTKDDTHGDAGVVLIDTAGGGFRFECFGGYLVVGRNGLPVSKYESEVQP